MKLAIALPLFLLLAGSTPAQVHAVFGDLRMDRFGESVDGAGDVDGDGFDDFLVGARHDFNVVCTGSDVSYLRVFSGKTGAVIRNHPDDGDDHRGSIVRGLGDFNGDGFADYGDANAPDFCCAITSPKVRVYSGLTGSLLFSTFAEWYDIFDSSLESAGDPNNDGFDDVLLGEPDCRGGVVSLRAGPAGALVLQITGVGNEGLGYSVAGVGDWDGDLRNDIAYSNHPNSASPTTTVVNILGSVLFSIPVAGEIQDPGDFDTDGTPDLFLVDAGVGRVYSGASGVALLTLAGWNHYAVADDVNGDGTRDFVASNPSGGGVVVVLDGTNGAELIRLREGSPGDKAGFSIQAAGDVDGDGRGDFIVGAIDAAGDKGAAYVYVAPMFPAPTNYCLGLPNSAGPGATLGIEGTWSLANNDLRLVSSLCPPNQFGVMFYGKTATSGTPVGEGLLCVGSPFFRLLRPVSTGAPGVGEYEVDLTAPPANSGPGEITAGSTMHFQFWYRDPMGGPIGYNFSEGLSVTFSN